MGTQERDHHRAIGDDVARQTDIEQRQALDGRRCGLPSSELGIQSNRDGPIEPNGISCVVLPSLIVVGKSAWYRTYFS